MPAQINVRTDISDIAYKVSFKTTVLVSVSRKDLTCTVYSDPITISGYSTVMICAGEKNI